MGGLPSGESAAPGAGGAPRATVGSPPKKAGAAAKGCPRLTPKEICEEEEESKSEYWVDPLIKIVVVGDKE